jgi:hypothetical protein
MSWIIKKQKLARFFSKSKYMIFISRFFWRRLSGYCNFCGKNVGFNSVFAEGNFQCWSCWEKKKEAKNDL